MPFNPNIPQPSDLLSDSQGDLLGNMSQLDTSFGVDHFAFSNLTSNNGFHQKVTLPGNLAAPAPAANYGDIFGVTDANSVTRPFWVRDGLPITYSMIPVRAFGRILGSTGATVGNAMNMSVARTSTGNYTVTLTAGAVFDTNYSVFFGIHNTSGARVIAQVSAYTSATQFTFNVVNVTGGFVDTDSISISVLYL